MRPSALFVAAALCLVASATQAPLLSLNESGRGTLALPGRSAAVQMASAGIGTRRVRFLVVGVVSVYEARLLVDADYKDKVAREADRILDSLERIPTVAVQMTFRRRVSAEDVSRGFRRAFEANGYRPASDPDLSRLEQLITRSSEIKSGTKVIVAMAAMSFCGYALLSGPGRTRVDHRGETWFQAGDPVRLVRNPRG